ncbi:unnamed protein product [Prorocentrum cordatum]|uniref:Receptor expression-enhancing protein n=1 Tax=Prorocentrum cordatum TaxID=2364126 RepID=A0ABN9XKQ4_9DINO|nr:unnamed protein product [Polarella glacialis]
MSGCRSLFPFAPAPASRAATGRLSRAPRPRSGRHPRGPGGGAPPPGLSGAMLPHFVNVVLWAIVSVALPAVQTFHALQEKTDGPDAPQKTWLFYWVAYVAMSWVFFYFDWAFRIPFFVLSWFMDVYFEVQILLVLFLVLPKTQGIRIVQAWVKENGVEAAKTVMDQTQGFALEGYRLATGVLSGIDKRLE